MRLEQKSANPPALAYEPWRAAVTEAFCPMDIRRASRESFRGRLQTATLLRLQLAEVASPAIRVSRDRAHIGSQCTPRYLLKFQLEGRARVSQHGRTSLLERGDFVLCSTADPYLLEFERDYRQAVLALPYPLLQERLGARVDDILGMHMPGARGVNRLLTDFVGGLVQESPTLDDTLLEHLEATALDLVLTCLRGSLQRPPAAQPTGAAQRHLQTIKRFIEDHLADPELGPEGIADSHGISKRYLHLLFSRDGTTVSRYIQLRRLEACRHALERAGSESMSTTDIAVHWCFADASHFHRCFKARYGMTPRQYRSRCGGD